MTAQFSLGDFYTPKRKADTSINSSKAKSKRSVKKSKTARERERLLLENFVKYGILPSSSPTSKDKSISMRIPTAISPLRTPGRQQNQSEDQTVPDIDLRDAEYPASKKQTLYKYWRPWMDTSKDEIKGLRTMIHSGQTKKKLAKCDLNQSRLYPKSAFPKSSAPFQRHFQYDTEKSTGGHFQRHVSKASNLRNLAQPNLMNKRLPFSPSIQTWDTRSLEFFRSFKQPVKLMYPRSQAFDYKYKDAQQLLQAFPVQATVGFYEDRDSEDESANKMIAEQLRHLAAQRCTSVFN